MPKHLYYSPYFIQKNWKDAIEFSRTFQHGDYSVPELSEEIEQRGECQDRYVLKLLKTSLTNGYLAGEIGHGLYDLVDTKIVEDSLRTANKIGTKMLHLEGKTVQTHYNPSSFFERKKLEKVRTALQTMANYGVESMCTSEIERAKDERTNWKIISLCSEAVMVGKFVGLLIPRFRWLLNRETRKNDC